MTQLINEWMSDEAVFRTAPATPGLLITKFVENKYIGLQLKRNNKTILSRSQNFFLLLLLLIEADLEPCCQEQFEEAKQEEKNHPLLFHD